MKERNSQILPYITAAIALLLSILFKSGGAMSIVIAGSFGVVLVFLKRSEYLPSIILLCSIGNTCSFLIFFSMIFVCILESKLLFADKSAKILYLLLLGCLPLFFVLIFQRHHLDGDLWQVALSYAQYYLSFWAFLYFYLISSPQGFLYKPFIAVMVAIIIFSFITSNYASINRLSLYAIALFGGLAITKLLSKTNILLWIIVFAFITPIAIRRFLTFTNVLVVLGGVLLSYLAFRNRKSLIKFLGAYPIYIFWAILILYCINHYYFMTAYTNSERVDFSSWNSFSNYLTYKIMGDRAPYWDGALIQLIELKPILPMHDIPDIYYSTMYSEGEVEFGGHNTYLQLLRIFGFLMGGILIFSYVFMSTLATRGLLVTKNPIYIAVFSSAISYMVFFCLTGTGAMLTDSSIVGFGCMGVAYRYSRNE